MIIECEEFAIHQLMVIKRCRSLLESCPLFALCPFMFLGNYFLFIEMDSWLGAGCFAHVKTFMFVGASVKLVWRFEGRTLLIH